MIVAPSCSVEIAAPASGLSVAPSCSIVAAFTVTTDPFDVQPPGNTWTIEVESTAWMEVDELIFIPGAGIFTVTAIISPTLVAVNYPALEQNTHDGDVIPAGTRVVPSTGLRVVPACADTEDESFLNTEQSFTAECEECFMGEPVTVTIPAGAYVSPTSQEAANALALAAATEQAEAELECEELKPEPEFYWNFDEESGDRVDEIEGVHLLETFNPPASGDGLSGNGLRFGLVSPGTIRGLRSDWADPPIEALAYPATDGLEIVCWAKFDDFGTVAQAIFVRFEGYDVSDLGNSTFQFLLRHFTGFGFTVEMNNYVDATSASVSVNPAVPIGEWVMLRGFWDAATGKVGFSINGGAVTLSEDSTTMNPSTHGAMRLFQSISGGGTSNDYSEDELGVYYKRLSDEQIALLYNSGYGQTYPFQCPPPPPPPSVPVLVLNGSSPSSIFVQFTQETEPESTEIWRSDNGGSYALIATIDGALTEYADVAGIPSGAVWCYKVRGVIGETNGEFSNVGCAVRDMSILDVGVVAHPTWMLAFGILAFDDPTLVTSLDLSGLLYVEDAFALDNTQALASLNLDSLAVVGGEFNFTASALHGALSLPALATVGGDLTFTFAEMSSLSLPVLASVAGNIECDSCPNLVTVYIPNFIMADGSSYHFDNCPLSVASIEHILARAIASGVVSATISLDSGAHGLSELSVGAQADYATLTGLGNTVLIDP